MRDETPTQSAGPATGEPGSPGGSAGREVWATRAGFIFAAVGSAVGLGNMWRFPYVTAEMGGAAFVLLYILMIFLLGIPVLLAEFAVGRSSRLSPVGALRSAGGKAWAPLGYLFVLTGVVILSYYAVIAGWVARYAITGIFAGFPAEPGAYFESIASGGPAAAFHVGFMAITMAIVMGGIRKGIERASLIMMPLLFLVVLGLAVWAVTLSGSGDGYSFYLAPDMSALFRMETLAEATGQAFFSLSLGMGAMLTFSSYLSKDSDMPQEAGIIAFSDFGVAFVAGLVAFPVIFALGLQGAVGESTIGALFIALPGAFDAMGPIGRLVGGLFFGALFIGALTSALSLLEVVTASIIDEWRITRRSAVLAAGGIITLIGLWPALDLGALDALDSTASNMLLPLGGLLLAVFVGWLMKNPVDELARGAGPTFRPLLKGWLWTLRVLAPVLLVLVLYTTVPTAIAALRGLFGA